MSGFLGDLAGQAGSFLPSLSFGPSWQDRLRPASFRGVPFYVDEAGYTGGRRIDTKEFPYRDDAASEDLGRAARRFQLRGYVIGDGYLAARDALERAVEGTAGTGILVHPYRGSLTCRAGLLRSRENKEEGGWCTFEIEFVVDGRQSSPSSAANTASGLLSGLGHVLPLLAAGYGLASLVISNPAILAGFAQQIVGGAAASFLGLPESTVGTLAGVVADWTATPSDSIGTGARVAGAFDSAAGNVAAAANAPLDDTDAVTGVPIVASAPDFSGGLAALATYGDGVPPIPALADYYGGSELSGGGPVLPPGVAPGYTGYTGPVDPGQAPPGVSALAVQQAVTQQAIVDLVEGAATYATISVSAQIEWTVADDADAARALILSLVDRRLWAAACADAPDLYRAWSAVAGLAAADLVRRAQALPRRTTYALPASLPSVVLAQRLYADADRADELATLNAWPHPLFMPPAGIRLSA